MSEKLTNTSDFSRKVGRPTPKAQKDMEENLRIYYKMNISAQEASKQPGMPSDKTCEKYFRLWTEQYRENYREDISERQKDAKMRMIAVYDSLILKLNIQLNKFTGLILEDQRRQETANDKLGTHGKPAKQYVPNPYYEGMFKGLIRDIAVLCDAKTALEMQPTIDEEHEQSVLSSLAKKQEKNPQ